MSADLINSRTPILGTSAHALASPLPYGIGVYSIDSNGEKQALPVYFVSPKMALLRPRGVKPGGYVEAVPGTEFEIRTTAIHPKFLGVKGRKFRKGRTVDVNVIASTARMSTVTESSGHIIRGVGNKCGDRFSRRSRQATVTVLNSISNTARVQLDMSARDS